MNHENMKMTEVGWIPKDWEVKTIGEIGKINGQSINPATFPECMFAEYSMPAYDEGQKPILTYGKTMQSSRIQITDELLLVNKLNVRQRRIWYVPECQSNSVCSGEFLPFKSESCNLTLLKQIFLSDKVVSEWNELSTGTSNSQRRITPKQFLDYSIALPTSPSEQRRIASVLSDTDSLIASLSRTIEKKRLVKQGAMQQLLTGKTRLKGFSGEWVEKELGECADIYRGGSPRPIEAFITTSPDGLNWIKIGDVANNAKYITLIPQVNN